MRTHARPVLLITPPLVQANTPYAATPLLTARLLEAGIPTVQADLSLQLVRRLFSREGLTLALRHLQDRRTGRQRPPTAATRFFLAHADRYLRTVGPVMRFLEGRHPALAERVLSRRYLPEGPSFAALDQLDAFGVATHDDPPAVRARLLAGLYLDDLAAAWRDGVDPRFGFSRYAERLAAFAPAFTPLQRALRAPPTPVDNLLDTLTDTLIDRIRPGLVGLTLPFPGTVYGAFRIAARIKARHPDIRTVAGGGFVSTELRDLDDPRVFDSFDHVVLDDGFDPLCRLATGTGPRVRTFSRPAARVVYEDTAPPPPRAHRTLPPPTYRGLPLARYVPVTESANPMHRLWFERRWMKLILAHGCYWHRCAFCDTSLDYIRRFDPADAAAVLRWIEAVIEETGETGFHFVDEAAPPALLAHLSDALIRRGLRIQWWTNIRFEPAFTPDAARRMARAGCVAVTGGLEAAHPALLRAMRKGLDLAVMGEACRALARAGILVHAYLMYGFPGQTRRQTIAALNTVLGLFAEGALHSAFWHRFSLTVHSPVYAEADAFGIRPAPVRRARVAPHQVPNNDRTRPDHEELGAALRAATYNYMHGIALDRPAREWFS